MAEKKIIRGISEKFADAFKESCLYKLYFDHKHDLILGVRNNYLNLYYDCDSIAKIEYKKKRGDIKKRIYCTIDQFYLEGENGFDICPQEICDKYNNIIEQSKKKNTDEKKAQSQLVSKNNNNPNSNWFCVDVEYKKQFPNIEKRDFNGRFDIIAISKSKPHQIALIELKYGSKALGGKSGIYKHVKDFSDFCDKGYFEYFKKEIISIINSQIQLLDTFVPKELHNLDIKNISPVPELYFIILNNNAKPGGSTPKQRMAAYLFKDQRWDCKRLSSQCVEKEYGDITRKSNKLHASFLFSQTTLPDIEITDIIDGTYEEIIRPE